MSKKMRYIIKDEKGNFITPRAFTFTDEGWLYFYYTGRCTGFVYFLNEEKAIEELLKLKNLNNKYSFGKKFYIKYIDIKNIKIGNNVIESLSSVSNKKIVNL